MKIISLTHKTEWEHWHNLGYLLHPNISSKHTKTPSVPQVTRKHDHKFWTIHHYIFPNPEIHANESSEPSNKYIRYLCLTFGCDIRILLAHPLSVTSRLIESLSLIGRSNEPLICKQNLGPFKECEFRD